MRVLTFEAVQDPEHPEYDPATGGAFITCFLVSVAGDPLVVAQQHIRSSGWIIIDKTGDSEADPNDCPPDDENYQHIVQAVADGEVYVFNSWPADDAG